VSVSYVQPREVRVIPVPGAVHPRLEIEGDRCVMAAHFKLVFPLSHADRFISIQDSADREIAILETLEGMDRAERQIIEDELDRRYFTPAISRIDDLKQDAGMWRFTVQTQRGPAEFFVRNWRDSAHEAAGGRWQIHSVDGLRFEIRNVDNLDARSQSLLEQLL
jgi:hypothetical protein